MADALIPKRWFRGLLAPTQGGFAEADAGTSGAKPPRGQARVGATSRSGLPNLGPAGAVSVSVGSDAAELTRPSTLRHPIDQAFLARRYDDVIDAIELLLRQGLAETPQRAWQYSRSCNAIGQPDRLVRTASRFARRSWHNRGFRTQYFHALISLLQLSEARDFIRQTVMLGLYDREMLFKIVAEYRHLDDDDLTLDLIDILSNRFSDATLSRHESVFIQNVLINIGRKRDAMRISGPRANVSPEVDDHFLMANYFLSENNYPAAIVEFNAGLERYDLSPVRLRDAGKPISVANLAGTPGRPRRGRLVSIAMPAYNAGQTILPALTSLSAQTYEDIEIIVVDDCGSDNTSEVVERYRAEIDRRVKLLKVHENGGPYRARNAALHVARGAYFTCNDADDWSHPEKIALLVGAMEDGRGAAAAQGQLLRISPTLGIKPRRTGYPHADMSSTMVRLPEIIDKLGFYDPVRFGADSEYIARIAAVFGEGSLKRLSKPLLIAQWAESTLTTSPSTGMSDGGIFYPKRAAYRHQYRMRHALAERLRISREDAGIVEPTGVS